MPLVLAKRSALKREVVQQRVCRAADQDLDRAILVDSAVALPDMPSPRDDFLDGCVVELDGDGEPGRTVEHRVCADKEAEIWIDSHQEGLCRARTGPATTHEGACLWPRTWPESDALHLVDSR